MRVGLIFILWLLTGSAQAAGPQPCYFSGAFTKCFTTSGVLVPQISWTDTTKGIVGTTTNDNAASTYVGEYLIQSRVFSAKTALTSNTPINVTATKLTLTAGDWTVGGSIGYYASAGAVVSVTDQALSKTSATLPGTDTLNVPTSCEVFIEQANGTSFVPGSNVLISVTLPLTRCSVSSSTDIYLVAQATFTTSPVNVVGSLWARRER